MIPSDQQSKESKRRGLPGGRNAVWGTRVDGARRPLPAGFPVKCRSYILYIYTLKCKYANHDLYHLSFLKKMRLIMALRNPRRPTVSEGRDRGLSESVLYATSGQRVATQRHHWARVNYHVVASKFRGRDSTARRQKRKRPQARLGRLPTRWNLADWAWSKSHQS